MCETWSGAEFGVFLGISWGKLEADETPEEALSRELKEELKIEVVIEPEVFEDASYTYDFGTVHMKTLICHLKSGEPVLTEHVDLKWLVPSQLEQLEWAPVDIPTVKKLVGQGDIYG